ncbi:MAG: hypothetical protein ACJ761_04545 [Chloroflexota bacterium]
MTNDSRPDDPFAARVRDPWAAPGAEDGTTTIPAGPSPDPMRQEASPAGSSRRRGAGLLVNGLLAVALLVAVGGVAFAAGRVSAPVAAAANGGGRFNNNGGATFGGPAASGAPGGGLGAALGGGGVSLEGTVTAISADSVTLQLADGQSVTIPIDAQTTYHQRAAATASSVTKGTNVIVQLQGGRAFFGNGNNGNGNGGPSASDQPGRTFPAAGSITVVPTGS